MKRVIFIILILFIQLKLSSPLYSQTNQNVSFVGRWADGKCRAIFADSNFVYLGSGGQFKIYSHSDPSHLQLLGQTPIALNGIIKDISITGNIAAVAADEAGAFLIDINNPTSPIQLGSYAWKRRADVIEAVGNRLYVGAGYFGLRILDITNPTAPLELGYFSTEDYPVCIKAVDSLVYLIDFPSKFRIINVADPTSPVEIGSWDGHPNYGYMKDIFIDGNLAYIVGAMAVFFILDISQPSNIQLVSSVGNISGYSMKLDIQGQNAFVVTDSNELYSIDLNNLNQPQIIGYHQLPGDGMDIGVDGNYAYIATGEAGMGVFDLINTANPQEIGYYGSPTFAENVTIENNLAFISDLNNGIRILDISNPSTPREISFYDTPGHTKDVAIKGNYAYVADTDSGLRVIDISDIMNPQELYFLKFNDDVRCVEIQNNILYVGEWGLRIFDITDPLNIQMLGYYDTNNHTDDLKVKDSLVYIVDNGFRVIKAANPTSPTHLGYISLPAYDFSLDVHEGFAYVVSGGLWVIDTRDPTNPTQVSSLFITGGAACVSATDGYAYVGTKYEGMRVIDISVPQFPHEVGYFKTPDYINGITHRGNYVVAANDLYGVFFLFNELPLLISKNQIPHELTLQQNYPNPFNPTTHINYSIPNKAHVKLTIYNSLGQEIVTLVNKKQPAGNYTVFWNGKDRFGNKVASGVYFYTLNCDDFVKTRQMILTK